MSFFQRLLGGSQQAARKSRGGGGGGEPTVAPDDLVDVCFDEGCRNEAELAALLQSYERAQQLDREVAREVLLNFFDRFAATCAAWKPEPSAIIAARAAAAAEAARADAGGAGGRAHVQMVRGCSGGHPRALLAAAVECLELSPKALSQAAAAASLASPPNSVHPPAPPPKQQQQQQDHEASEAAVERQTETASGEGAAGRSGGQQQQLPSVQQQALLQGGGLPVLHALRVLLRSKHNRAVLVTLGLLPALCDLSRQLAQKLQAAAGVLAVRSSSGSLASLAAATPAPPASPSKLRSAGGGGGQQLLLEPLMVLLQATLAVVQAFIEHEAAHQQQHAAMLAGRGSGKATSHAALAASQQSALAAAMAAAAAATAAAVAPLLEGGLLERCCNLLPVLTQILLHSSTANAGRDRAASHRNADSWHLQQCGGGAVAAAMATERRALLCLLAFLEASPGASSAVLAQTRGGHLLELLAGMLGWPLAPADQQPLPLSSSARVEASGSSGSLSAASAAQQPAEELSADEEQRPDGLRDSYTWVNSGGGLRPANQELALQLLLLRVLGAACRAAGGGGAACLRLVVQQGGFARITQVLQWCALTFDAGDCGRLSSPCDAQPAAAEALSKAPPVPSPSGAAISPPDSPKSPELSSISPGSELTQLFQALWSWLAGGAGTGTGKALLSAMLAAVLAAFRPEAPAGVADAAAANAGTSRQAGSLSRSGSPAATDRPLALSAASASSSRRLRATQLFHEAALDALCGEASGAAGAGMCCGCGLQQQVLLLAARLMGREQRILPLLPSGAAELQEDQHHLRPAGSGGSLARWIASGSSSSLGGLSSTNAWDNLQALRAAGFWELLFGPAFFFWSTPQLTAALPSRAGTAADSHQQQDSAAATGRVLQRERLRQLVLAVLEAAASLPATSSNLAELSALLALLQQHPDQHAVTAAACRLLLRLLGSAPATSLAALQDRQLLLLLPRLLAQQLAREGTVAAAGAQDAAEATSGGSTADETSGGQAPSASVVAAELAALEETRCAALELLGAFMSMHVSLQRAAVAAWEPVAALFSLLLRPACFSRRLALDNVLLLMQVPPASEDDRLAKAALYTKYTETLPAAVRRWRELGTRLLLELLGGMRAAVDGGGGGSGGAGNRVAAQRLFAQSQGFLQVCNVLNEEYSQEAGPELCCCVLDTLTVLLAGSPANRRALAENVGYGLLLEAIVKRLGGKPPPRRLLLCATGLLLEETPGPGELPRFASSAIANPAALPLMLALLRRAADQDQLWGLAAFRELLLQGAQNLAAADGAGLNGLLIEWLAATTAQEPAAAALAGDGSRIDAAAAGPDNKADMRGGPPSPDALTQRLMLQQQLLALLRVSGSYSISARDLRSLLHLLKPSAEGVPPQQSAMLLEALAAMASHEGPRCFFNFSGGGSGSSSNAGDIQPGPGQQHSVAQAARLPSGIVCSASLGGGTGGTGNAGGTSSTGSSSAASFLRLPRSGYSFAAWLRLEDGRGAAEQLAEAALAQSFQSLLLSQQQEMSPGAVAAATAAAAAVATDQAVYALLHLPHSASQQLMHGVALAVRAVHGASEGTAGGTGSFRGGPALQLVAHCWAPKHSEAVLPLQQPLVPGRWHHVALTHSAGGALSHPALHLYLDGVLQATARLRYPSIKEPLSSVCLGTGALMRPFRGQAGAALLFEDVLAPGQVAALHQLGPDYQSPLLGASESSGLLDQHPAAAAALALGGDGGGGSGGGGTTVPGQPPKLLLAFCPQAAAAAEDDASRGSGAGARHGGRAVREAVQGLPAALLAGTQLCRTMQPRDMLHCLGGVAVLLPLLEVQLGPGAWQGQEQALAQRRQPGRLSWPPSGDPRAGVLRLLAAMLRGSPTNQQAMQEIGGFSLAAHLLEQAPHPRRVLNPELLAAQQQVLGAVGESSELTRDVLRHLLLNVQLWGTAAPAVQLQVLALWCQLAEGEPQLVRLLLPPARLLHHVRRRFFSGGGAASLPAYLAPSTGGGTGGAAGVAGPVPLPDAPRQLQQQEETAAASELALDKPVRQQPEAQQPRQQDEAGGAAEEKEEEEAAHVAELRRSHLQLAALIITQSAAAGPEQQGHTAMAAAGANPAVYSSPVSLPAEAGRPLSSHASASGGDEGLAADLQAALSLVADCCTSLAASRAVEAGGSSRSSNGDAALLQELLSVLLLPVLRRGSLARLPLLACLARLGGPSLLLPVLSLDQQQLRLLGLKAIAACLSTGNTSAAGSTSQPLPTGQQQHPPQRFDPNDQLIAAAGQLLAAFQLTAPTRITLFELLCGGLPWQQIDSLAPAGPAVAPAGGAADSPGRAAGAASALAAEVPTAASHHVAIKHPAAAAVLLQMAAEPGCSQGERAAVLGMLCLLCESASLSQQARHGNLDMLLAAPCPWPSLLLACLAGGSTPGGGKTSSSRSSAKARVEPSAQRDEVVAAAWRLLVLLLARAVVASPGGWQLLHAVAGLLKAQPQRLFSLPAASSGDDGSRSGAVEHGVSGWRLLQEALSDVMQELLAAQAADASAVAATSGGGTAAGAADVPSLGVRAAPRRRSSEWDAWTLVSQWSTEPYCSNAAALLALLDDLLCGTAVTPPGISPAPSGSALLWGDPAAADAVGSGGASGNRGSEGTVPAAVAAAPDSIPAAVWRELGALPWQQAQQQQQAQQAQQAQQEASGPLLLTAWRFLDRLHTSGAAAAAAAEAASPGSPASILLRVTRGLAGLAGLAGGNGGGADSGGGAAGLLSEQQLMLLQQRRGLLLLQRLLLQALRHSPPELAAQAAAQAAQLLPLLLSAAGAGAGEGPAAEAAAGQLHLLLAALVQCYRDVSARSAAEQQEGQLLPLKVQQRLDACVLAANAVVDSWPAAFGLPAEPQQQAQPAARSSQQHQSQQHQIQQQQQHQRWPGQQGRRLMQELMQLLLPQQVVAAARQQLLFMRHCAGLHAAACPQLQQQMQAAATAQQQRAAAAEEGSRQCLGGLLAADRLRRAAGRQAAEEAVQHRRRRWRDLRRGLTSGRGLWADEERPEELHWKQDSVEDSSRRRLRLRRNYHFQRYSDTSVGVSSEGEAAAAGGERGAGAAAEADEEAALLALAKLVPGALPSPAPEDDLELSEEEGEGGEEGENRPRDNEAQAAVQQRQQQPLADDAGNKAVEDLSAADAAPQQPLDQPVQPPQQKAAGESRAAAAASLGAQAEQAPQQPDFVEPEQQAAAQPVGSTQEEGHLSPSRQAQQQQQQQRGQEHRRPPSVKDAPGPTPPRFEQQTSQDVEASAPAAVAAAASASAAEALLFSSRCSWVTPKRVLAGQLHVTPTQLHFVSDPPVSPFAAQPSTSSGRGSAGAEARAAVGEVASSGGQAETGEDEEAPPPRRRHQRWQLGQLTEVHHSRFLLQPTALECFTADRSSHALFAFPSNQAMREAAAALARARPGLPVYDRRRKVEWALRLQQRWLRWEISTFEYLMGLNTLAGRTYNDLNQYPVMPWVLSDFTSEALDLNDPSTFRDLSKPIGALNPRRWEFFADRFESLRGDAQSASEMPPFHYGSHYSSAGIVLFYLLRLESFTKMNRALQGGRFDHGDRLFHSVAATWQNCLDNTADVKELTPEFYYQPEFLLNANGFDLGTKQDGAAIGDVVLPPWAHGSPHEFVRVMREALEGDHVSQHMHHWIDLVFGAKQRGRAAEEACNVFYHLTYEGTVDLDAIPDPALREAVEEQTRHFGQTPIQLFRRRHPPRGPPPPPALNPLLNGPDVMRRSALAAPPPQRSGVPVSGLWVTGDGRVLQLFADRTASVARWYPTSRADLGAFTFAATGGLLPDASAASLEPDLLPPRMLLGAWAAAPAGGGVAGGAAATVTQQLQFAVLHGERVVVSGGYWDCSLRAHSPEDGRLLQSLSYHKDVVTCLAASSDGQVVVTGSADTTLMVWDASTSFGKAGRGRQPLPLLPRPRCSLHGHRDAVTCVAVSPDLDLVASGAADGTLLLHSLSSGRYVRSLVLPHGVPPSLICLVPHLGVLVAHSYTDLQLHLYTVNGRRLASEDTHERLACLCPTPDGRLMLVAGTSGLVSLRWLHSLQVVLRYDGGRGPVTSLAITPEGCFLAGTAEGSLVLFAPDPRRRITRRAAVV